jgi:hypothetical protein
MKSSRYKRLCLVLAIPLLISGFWVAENEVFSENNALTSCTETKEQFSCNSIQISRKELNALRDRIGGLWIWPDAHLTGGFDAPVVSIGATKTEYKAGALQNLGTIGAGVKKTLHVDRFQGANYASPGPCTLDRYANEDNAWHLSCISGISEGFKFLDKTTEAKYQKLFQSLDTINLTNAREAKKAYIFSVLLPLLSFLIISAIIFCLMKCISFIWNDRKLAVT